MSISKKWTKFYSNPAQIIIIIHLYLLLKILENVDLMNVNRTKIVAVMSIAAFFGVDALDVVSIMV